MRDSAVGMRDSAVGMRDFGVGMRDSGVEIRGLEERADGGYEEDCDISRGDNAWYDWDFLFIIFG